MLKEMPGEIMEKHSPGKPRWCSGLIAKRACAESGMIAKASRERIGGNSEVGVGSAARGGGWLYAVPPGASVRDL